MTRTRLSTALLFVLLTIGYAVVHETVSMWISTILSPFLSGEGVSENVQVMKSGEVLLARHTRRAGLSIYDQTYHTLDGTDVTATVNQTEVAYPAGISTDWRHESPHIPLPVSWSRRLASLNDQGTPPAYWYVVTPSAYHSNFYLQGFDKYSKRCIGYLGIDGYSPQVPAPQSQFLASLEGDADWRNVLVSNHNNLSSYPDPTEPIWQNPSASDYANVKGLKFWVLSQETVYEIDPRQRSLRKLATIKGARRLTSSTVEEDGRRTLHLLLRSTDGLTILEPDTLKQLQLPLKPTERNQFMSYLAVADGESLVMTTTLSLQDSSQPRTYELQWFDRQGELLRTETHSLKLVRDVGPHPMLNSAGLAIVMPTPLIPSMGLVVAPVFMAWEGDDRDYATRLAEVCGWLWAWLTAAVLIGFACGWACRRRELEIYQNRSWLWPVVVGVLGWFGWVAYHCLRPLPARLPNRSRLPARPEPNRPLGYEVFA